MITEYKILHSGRSERLAELVNHLMENAEWQPLGGVTHACHSTYERFSQAMVRVAGPQ